jgi:hypothetical protein
VREEATMSFTTLDVGFGAKRFSFEGPDFGVFDSVKARDNEPDVDDDDDEEDEEEDDDTESEKAWVSSPGIRF